MSFTTIKLFLNKYRNEHPFVFYFMLIYLGGLLIYIIIFLIFFADLSSALSLNEVGDFLAGAFSPIAFLFLYLGYRQNSEALKIQAEELKQSTDALRLQVAEMKESVEQQKIISQLQQLELDERHNSITPIFTGSGFIQVANDQWLSEVEPTYSLRFILNNPTDNEAKNLKLNIKNIKEFNFNFFPKNSKKQFDSKLTDEEIIKYKAQEEIERIIEFEFENIFGRRFSQAFIFECKFTNEVAKFFIEDLGASALVKDTQPH